MVYLLQPHQKKIRVVGHHSSSNWSKKCSLGSPNWSLSRDLAGGQLRLVVGVVTPPTAPPSVGGNRCQCVYLQVRDAGSNVTGYSGASEVEEKQNTQLS